MAKGRAKSLDLIRLVLQFVMGKHAVTEDLSPVLKQSQAEGGFLQLAALPVENEPGGHGGVAEVRDRHTLVRRQECVPSE